VTPTVYYTYARTYIYIYGTLWYNIIYYVKSSTAADPTRVHTLRAGDLVQTERRYLYTPKRIVCLISRPQWALNDPAAAAAAVRSLPRLMTAPCSAADPPVRAVYDAQIYFYARDGRRPPLPGGDIVSSDFSLRCAPLLRALRIRCIL